MVVVVVVAVLVLVVVAVVVVVVGGVMAAIEWRLLPGVPRTLSARLRHHPTPPPRVLASSLTATSTNHRAPPSILGQAEEPIVSIYRYRRRRPSRYPPSPSPSPPSPPGLRPATRPPRQ